MGVAHQKPAGFATDRLFLAKISYSSYATFRPLDSGTEFGSAAEAGGSEAGTTVATGRLRALRFPNQYAPKSSRPNKASCNSQPRNIKPPKKGKNP